MTQPLLFEGWSPVLAIAEYGNGSWSDMQLRAEQTIGVHPAAMALQFGASAFEGYKVYKTTGGYHSIRLNENFQRLENTCARMCIPCPSYALYRQALALICSQDSRLQQPFSSDWIYLRPVVIATDSHIMPVISSHFIFAVMAAPIREYQGEGFNLWVEREYGRACDGGLGFAKTAANYAHQFLPTKLAEERGCDSLLWLDAKERKYIEEGSTMNVFFKIDEDIHTPALTDTILAGITRMSAIALLNKHGYQVIERKIAMDEIPSLVASGRLREMFITATALGVGKVKTLQYQQQTLSVSPEDSTATWVQAQLKNIYLSGSAQGLGWQIESYSDGGAVCLAS